MPPADHSAGRWALALVLAGWLAGRARREHGSGTLLAMATVAVCSLAATSVFAFTGILLEQPAVPAAEALRVVPLAVVLDVLAAPLVLPPVLRALRALRPPAVAVA